jgi:hypothetical protein
MRYQRSLAHNHKTLCRRKGFAFAALADADELMEAYGIEAYSVARQLIREARVRYGHADSQLKDWSA